VCEIDIKEFECVSNKTLHYKKMNNIKNDYL